MKVFLNFSLLFFIIFSIIGLNTKKLISEKINFREGNLDLVSCSLDENIDAEEVDFDNVNFRVNLDVERFYYPCNVGPNATNEEVEEYKRLSRSAAKNYYKVKNASVAELLNIEGYLSKYVSSYAPIVEFDFTVENYLKYGKEALTILSSNNRIESIFVTGHNEAQLKPQMINSLTKTSAINDYRAGAYTGDGVRVGVIETGVVDEDHSNFSSSNLVVRDEWYYVETVSEHATQVASLIGGNNGIAPDATIYSVEAYGSLTGEIDWLLDNNVDIVNMSYAEYNNYGTYDDESAYYDYIAYHYNVTFVACASNNIESTHKVANPGLGYNVLTVGATTITDLVCGFSSHLTDPISFKPDIYAPGADIAIPGYSTTVSGTSFSTPIVTGLVALLMERYPTLKVRPAMVKALACASADYLGETTTEANGYDSVCGAGRFNYQFFGDNYSFFSVHLNPNSSSNANLYNETQVMYDDETFTACLSWLVYTDGTADSVDFTRYYFTFSNSNGVEMVRRQNVFANTLFMRIDLQYVDTYTLAIYRQTAGSEMLNPDGEYVALDMRIDLTPER